MFLKPFIRVFLNKLLLRWAHRSNLLCWKQSFQEANRITQDHLINGNQSKHGVQDPWPAQFPLCASEWLKSFSDMEVFSSPCCKNPFQECGKWPRNIHFYTYLYILFSLILRLVVHRPHFRSCVFKSSSELWDSESQTVWFQEPYKPLKLLKIPQSLCFCRSYLFYVVY